MTDRRYATVAMSLALVATAAGTGVAAPLAHTAKRLITGTGIKDGAVTSTKIRDRSLTRKDLAKGLVAAGADGRPGAAGPAGAAGTAGADGAPGAAAGTSPFVDGPGGGP